MGRNGKGIGVRREQTSLLCIFAFALCASSARPQAVPALDATLVASGLSQPVFATAPPGDYNRLFIVEQNASGSGRIRILNLQTGNLNMTPFLTVAGVATGGEQGLLGLAFDPNYATNRKFYILYVASVGEIRIVQYQASSVDPNVADTTASTIKTLLSFSHPVGNHNAGWIGFSPRVGDENNLYISSGDGGDGNDEDPPGGTNHHEPGGNAQWNGTLLGKILRIHVDSAAGTYTIPADNPFANSTDPLVKKEIWVLGLRNPYRDSFDRLTGRLFLGDVGQSSREEIDAQQPGNPGGGENYGWRLREGTIATPSAVGGPAPPGNVEPILDYDRSIGGTVIGGYVYRGKQIPALRGTYLFGDYVAEKIFTLDYNGVTASNFQNITSQLFPTAVGGITLSALSSFGEDANGEHYIADVGSGNVFKIVPVTPNVQIDSVTKLPDGDFRLEGTGVPFKSHTIQAVSNITQPFVTPGSNIGTAVAAGDGTFQFDDINASSSGMRFYRVVYP